MKSEQQISSTQASTESPEIKEDANLERIKTMERTIKLTEFKSCPVASIPAFKPKQEFKQNVILFKLPTCCDNYVPISNKFSYNPTYILGSGGFGNVYYGCNPFRTKDYAIKFQNCQSAQTLDHEHLILDKLKDEAGFPNVYGLGNFNGKKYIVEDLLGPSIDRLFKFCDRQFSPLTAVKISCQMLKRLHQMHKNGLLHRDIKPNNFNFGKFHTVLGKNMHSLNDFKRAVIKNFSYFEDELIYCIDFGLSVDDVPNPSNILESNFIGTLRYACLNSHYGKRQNKRDDLESLFYVMIYIYKGFLPWENLKIKDKKEKVYQVQELKRNLKYSEFFKSLPSELQQIYHHIMDGKYEDTLTYEFILTNLTHLKDRIEDISHYNAGEYLWDWEEKILRARPQDKFTNKESIRIQSEFSALFTGYPIIMENYIMLIQEKYHKLLEEIKCINDFK